MVSPRVPFLKSATASADIAHASVASVKDDHIIANRPLAFYSLGLPDPTSRQGHAHDSAHACPSLV